MGGPCLCNGKAVTPGTDNFEIVPFVLDGVQYYSAEQAYQALKMKKAADRAKIARCTPKPGEKAWDHGMRAWQAGQLGTARKDWEAIKVEAMYIANRCKLEQNPEVLASLLASNGTPQGKITHMGSGKFWDFWNPIILMLLREELSPTGGNKATIDALCSQMEAYRVSKRGSKSLLAEHMREAEGATVKDTAGAAVESAALVDSATPAPVELAVVVNSTAPVAVDDELPFEGSVLQLFRHMDMDATGKVDRQKLLRIFQRIDSSWSEERVDRILAAVDLNGDAPIVYEELVR